MKTNKSFTKRLRVTKNGKILGRKSGQNHFNAKENKNKKQSKKRSMHIHFTNKAKARFLPGMFKSR
jgi:ribosomal protein L35